MNALFNNKTIIACSTGLESNSAISIIRISGFKELKEIQSLFSKNIEKIKPKKMIHLDIVENSLVVDNVMISFFKEPFSYTGENILEIYAHGNILNTKRIIDLFCKTFDLRMALPGEFTYRAVKNKKMSITQAEGLDLFLNAVNGFMLKHGMDVLQGELHTKFVELYEKFKMLKANFELQIDFLEDVGEEAATSSLNQAMNSFELALKEIFNRTETDRSTLLTPKVVIVGQTNAGKSTFFNKILGNNRSIVSNIKGTTRDYISEYIQIKGNQFQLIDTAGLRDTFEEIEKEGIRRTKSLIKNSFFNILIINPFETDIKDLINIKIKNYDQILVSHSDKEGCYKEFKKLNINDSLNIIFCNFVDDNLSEILNFRDKSGPIEPGKSGPIEPGKSGPIEPGKSGPIEPDKSGPIEPGVLADHLFEKINNKYRKYIENDPILIERQRKYIQISYNKYLKLKELLSETSDIAICLSELDILENELNQLIGIVPSNDVIDTIFKNFCIGK